MGFIVFQRISFEVSDACRALEDDIHIHSCVTYSININIFQKLNLTEVWPTPFPPFKNHTTLLPYFVCISYPTVNYLQPALFYLNLSDNCMTSLEWALNRLTVGRFNESDSKSFISNHLLLQTYCSTKSLEKGWFYCKYRHSGSNGVSFISKQIE